jgi:hypothetical protein
MKITNQTKIGWVVRNGSGWNNHQTAKSLDAILDESPETLPDVPVGYAVLVAPISDRPFGLRCALVKIQARKIDIIDGAEYDDGVADDAGETDRWAEEQFGFDVERIHSVKTTQQSEDSSEYFIASIFRAITEQLAKIQ